MNKTISIIIAVIILILGGYFFTKNNKESIGESNEYKNSENNVILNTENTNPEDINSTNKKPALADDTHMAPVGSYEVYSPEKIAEKSKTSRVVLFFNASWCPTCRALNNSINVSRKQIPGDVTILSVDYDTYTELKKKYGVTYQHTLVQVDADGNMIKKWSGSPTLASLVQEIK